MLSKNNSDQDFVSSLDRFKQRLDRREASGHPDQSTRLPVSRVRADSAWREASNEAPPIKENSFLSRWFLRFFWATLVFFFATVALAIYILFFSSNIVSANNIDIEIVGPTELRSGDEVALDITVTNRNKVTLQDLSLTLIYPSGTVDSLEMAKDLPLWREKLSDLAPGQKIKIGTRAVIFGQQNSRPEIGFKLEYHIPDSNAVFAKEGVYSLNLESSTLDISFDLPAEININKNFTATLRLASNAKTVLRQVAVRLDYPSGFTLQTAKPLPLSGQPLWYLGDIPPGGQAEIVLTGSLSGLKEDLKSFKVFVALDKTAGQGDLGTEYGTLVKVVNLKRDFVSLNLDLGAKTSIPPGGNISGQLSWSNNLSDKVIDGVLELELLSPTLDKRTVRASLGFYDSLKNIITWDKKAVSGLSLVNPGDSGQVQFSFNALPLSALPTGELDPINLRAIFRGKRVTGDNNLEEEVVTENLASINIDSLVKVAGRSVYSFGPFRNTGPLPPKVGEETTYTIILNLSNTTNEIRNARLSATLPPYVRWLSASSPIDEKLVYSQSNRSLVWTIDKVAPLRAGETISREVSFQVAITPSLSQVKAVPDLLQDITFSGVDTLTNNMLNLSIPTLSTRLVSDPSYVFGQETVIE